MKKAILVSSLFLILSGCTPEKKDILTYKNEELGISFDYPEKFGPAIELKDSNGKLENVGFAGMSETEGRFELATLEKDYFIPTCDGFIPENPLGKCEVITLGDHSFLQHEDILKLDGSKSIQFQTKKGIWTLITGNDALYDDITEIAKTIQYLE